MGKHQAFWIGFFSAVLLAVPIAVGVWGAATNFARDLAVFIFGCVSALVLGLVVLLFFRDHLIQKFLGKTASGITDFSDSLVKFASATIAGRVDEAESEARHLARTGIAFYSWSNFYRWVIGSAIALLLAFGAFTGTVLLFEQNAKLQEQTLQFAVQNDILTLSIVNDLRNQLKSAAVTLPYSELADKGGDFPAGETFLTNDAGSCGLAYDPDVLLTTLPSQSTILAISSLASSQTQVSPKVIEALQFLKSDSDGSVAFSAILILDSLGVEAGDDQFFLSDLYLEHLGFGMTMEQNIVISDSVVTSLNCPNCKLAFYNSAISAGEVGPEPFVESSLVTSLPNLGIGNLFGSSAILAREEIEAPENWFKLVRPGASDSSLEKRSPYAVDGLGLGSECRALEVLAANSRVLKFFENK